MMNSYKKILIYIASVLVLISAFLLASCEVKATETTTEILNVKATAYCYNSGTTATGTVPKEGRTLAGKREWFGKTAILYVDKGNGIESENYIGTYIVEDTGGEPIRNGYVVDVFIEKYEDAKQFGSKKVIVVLIDAEG